MNTLTKEQVRKLPPEQQEALAAVEFLRIQADQRLLKRARRGMGLRAGVWMGLIGGVLTLSAFYPRTLPFAIMGVAGLAMFLAGQLHRRLDAVLELREQDLRRAAERNQNEDDHEAQEEKQELKVRDV